MTGTYGRGGTLLRHRTGMAPRSYDRAYTAYNVGFVSAEAVACCVAHYAFGVEWWQLAAGVVGTITVGVGFLIHAARRPPGWAVRVRGAGSSRAR